ncbi:unnamed protein product [Rotaria sp. Silwood2]|nr:unnamed protein product [Rotaria sp. Silwood2]CAF3457419.1 unnamed protein product [Rotaria sp. Silwood2]CAF4529846.1 unnamed protein product [Rotaria sp. Silwood2]CAF4608140.1 unnamed protein product [Rotaria sp. Silwood2]CAF4678351.1 unnamed protein product [Rotaria sp. Silwood2]
MQIIINSIFDSSLDNRSDNRIAKSIRQLEFLKYLQKKLAYPELITLHNVHELQQLIFNGPYMHTESYFIELENGTIRRLLSNNLS